jgi:hypothetical protein
MAGFPYRAERMVRKKWPASIVFLAAPVVLLVVLCSCCAGDEQMDLEEYRRIQEAVKKKR